MASAPPHLKLLNWDKKSINEQELSKGGLCKKGVSLLAWGLSLEKHVLA